MSGFAAIIKRKNLTVERTENEAMMAGLTAYAGKTDELESEAMTDDFFPNGRRPGTFFEDGNVALWALDGNNRTCFNEEKAGTDVVIVHSTRNKVIVFDGELTNLKTLKDELIDGNHHFYNAADGGIVADAEMVVHACEQWGMETALQRLDGAFAFTLYDRTTQTIYMARDKLGIKPLYYFKDHTGLNVSSALGTLVKNPFPKIISKEGLNLFFSLTYIPAPYTIYENVMKLPAGHYLTIHDEDAVLQTYYRLEDQIRPSGLPFERAKNQLNRLLTDSVKKLMDDDAPTGAFLSGGIDSSVVAALMSQHTQQPVPTFSIGFKEKEHDESDRALLVSETFHTDHSIHYLDYNDVKDVLDDIIAYFDEPFGDSSAIPTYYVAKIASEKVKTVFTGDCADELFGGYNKYLSAHYTNIFLRIPKPVRYLIEKTIRLIPRKAEKQPWIRKIKKIVTNASRSTFQAHFQSICLGCSDEERRRLLMPAFFVDIRPVIEKVYNRYPGDDNINNAMFADSCVSLEGDMFPKMERMCRMNTLSARSPFADTEIVRFALSLPAAYKVKGRKKKYILREAFKDLLPAKVLSSPKHGFTAPVARWLRNELKQDLLQLLDKERVEKQGILNVDAVTRLVEQHLKGEFDHSPVLWDLLVFQKWYAKNVLK